MWQQFCFAAFLLGAAASREHWQIASARCKDVNSSLTEFECTLKPGILEDADAVGHFQDSIEKTGWSKLHVRGVSGCNNCSRVDRLRLVYAAGFVEGSLTAERISQHISSYYEAAFHSATPSGAMYEKAKTFLLLNDNFVRSMINHPTLATDPYWSEIELVWAQLDGLLAGNAANCSDKCLTRLDFLFLQAEQDLSNLIHEPFTQDQWTEERAAEYTRATTHCSSIIRMAPGNRNVYMGHNTWTGYYTMLRVLKEYDLPLEGRAQNVVFSGYFGQLYSGDDFYSLSSGLTVQETTNALYNDTTAAQIQPNSVLTWARTIIANRRATDGRSWVDWFSPFNSGTINNQWQIAAMHLFEPGRSLPDGFLTVLEQMPGLIVWEDVTHVLQQQGWWTSFNSPYFSRIREVSGAAEMERRFGDAYSYTKNPRARIFARDVPNAHDLAAVKFLLRYNNWRNDPLSAGGYGGPYEPRAPSNAIAARYDLHPWANMTRAFGNTDGKICAAADCLRLRFEAVSGPTADQQPPFSWTGQWACSPHHGQPETFNFTWVTFERASDTRLPDILI